MSTVSIIGTGNMGQAIAGLVTKGGGTAELIARGDTDKSVTGDVVVLAVPYPAVADVIAARGEQLAGKVVVDITNPVDFATFDSLAVPAGSSAAAEIAGDDTDAKSSLADIVTAAGLRAVDAGSRRRARELEAVGFLQMTLAVSEQIGWAGGLAVIS